ncbi:uncharacterized protein LOC111345556 isoform X2 [Stylophora pistillata]|uniref:uncharacterized protein LOC111345556 isoform X2 n=1 Tax=Stylophora pistillata TaxID=50429 RepID=UPI000C03BD89|nr:uncharacterized protein LOC111345556 isoform X2 [Stylophora pistillata]
MNFRGFAFLMALFIAVQLTTFTGAAQNLTKTSGKDYDEQGKHLGEQPVRRMIEEECTLGEFSLGGGKPVFPEKQSLTFPICQDNHYATFYDNEWGIARYAVYKITPQQAKADRVPRVCDPWRPTEKIVYRDFSKSFDECKRVLTRF